jgi:sugar O-acyltransferase (sialic acid O-acetyltransferase NeuD family)
MKQDIVVLGAGGHGREILWLLDECNAEQAAWNVLGFIDENPALHRRPRCETRVLGGFEWLKGKRNVHLVSGVGDSAVRRRFARLGRELGLPFATLVHPDVKRSRFVEIGEGTAVFAGSILTTQVRVGRHASINLACTLSHDVVVDDFCTLAPGVHVSGAVHLGEDVTVGTGAVILPGRQVGRNTTIGAGAVVSEDLPADGVAVGVPARVIKTKAAS